MSRMPRFVLLEHTDAPDDPAGRHYDLLLEAGAACRTWRLADLPVPDGPAVPAAELPPHRPAWLDHVAGPVSGGRGFARRIDGGECLLGGTSPAVELVVAGRVLDGRLALAPTATGWELRLASGRV